MLLKELVSFFFEMQTDSCSTAKGVTTWVFDNRERCSIGLPDVLLVVIVFWCDNHTIGNWETIITGQFTYKQSSELQEPRVTDERFY